MGLLNRPTIESLEETIIGYELMIAKLERHLISADLDSAPSTEELQTMAGIQIELAAAHEQRAKRLAEDFP